MLRSLRIQNFKGWQDTKDLRLAPITVFFGSNSSGKSSIGQFLMMLKQTANSPDRNRVLHPGDANSPVDLGQLDELVFGRDIRPGIHFTVEWDLPKTLHIVDALAPEDRRLSGTRIRFQTSIDLANGKGVRAESSGFSYQFTGKSDAPFSATMGPDPDKPGKYTLSAEGLKLVRIQGRGWPLPPPVRFFGFPDELGYYYQNAGTLNDLALAM